MGPTQLIEELPASWVRGFGLSFLTTSDTTSQLTSSFHPTSQFPQYGHQCPIHQSINIESTNHSKEVNNNHDSDRTESDDDSFAEYQGKNANNPNPYRDFMPSLKTLVCEVLQSSKPDNDDDADEEDEGQEAQEAQEVQCTRNGQGKGKGTKAKGSKNEKYVLAPLRNELTICDNAH
jgi:hypothetical protein